MIAILAVADWAFFAVAFCGGVMMVVGIIENANAREARGELLKLRERLILRGMGEWYTDQAGRRQFRFLGIPNAEQSKP